MSRTQCKMDRAIITADLLDIMEDHHRPLDMVAHNTPLSRTPLTKEDMILLLALHP